MLKQDIYSFVNIVDPDQLASEKPADQDPQCFLTYVLRFAYNWNIAS